MKIQVIQRRQFVKHCEVRDLNLILLLFLFFLLILFLCNSLSDWLLFLLVVLHIYDIIYVWNYKNIQKYNGPGWINIDIGSKYGILMLYCSK